MPNLTRDQLSTVSTFHNRINFATLGFPTERADGISCTGALPFIKWMSDIAFVCPALDDPDASPSSQVIEAAHEAARIFAKVAMAASEAGKANEVCDAGRGLQAIGEILGMLSAK